MRPLQPETRPAARDGHTSRAPSVLLPPRGTKTGQGFTVLTSAAHRCPLLSLGSLVAGWGRSCTDTAPRKPGKPTARRETRTPCVLLEFLDNELFLISRCLLQPAPGRQRVSADKRAARFSSSGHAEPLGSLFSLLWRKLFLLELLPAPLSSLWVIGCDWRRGWSRAGEYQRRGELRPTCSAWSLLVLVGQVLPSVTRTVQTPNKVSSFCFFFFVFFLICFTLQHESFRSYSPLEVFRDA